MRKSASAPRSGKARYVWLALFAALLFTLTFFVARCAGTKEGHLDAAREIQEKGNVTAGPDSLI